MKLIRLPDEGAGAPMEGSAQTSVERPRALWSRVAKPLRDLVSALEDARAGAPGDDRLVAVDRVAVRLVAAIAPFLEEPAALLPAQRALLVMPGRPDAEVGLGGLQRALRRVDDRLGPELGGFSRLLDNALSAGDVLDVVRLRAAHVDEELRPLARRLEAVARELSALDDLSHALSLPAEPTAATIVIDALLALLEEGEGSREGLLAAWLAHRGLDDRLASLYALRGARASLATDHIDDAAGVGLSRALALWLLAHRLAARRRLDSAPDRPALDRLLDEARLLPLEVFDVASLWPELNDDDD